MVWFQRTDENRKEQAIYVAELFVRTAKEPSPRFSRFVRSAYDFCWTEERQYDANDS